MRSVCVCVCVSLSLLFGALQRPLIGNAHVFLCLSFSTFTLLGPTSFMLHGVHTYFFAILTSTFLVCACIFCIFVLHCFAVCFCTCFFAFLHFVCSFHLFFVALCFCPCIFFAFFVCFFALCFCPCIFLQCSFAFFITCCIFSRLQFSRIAHKPPTQS